MRSNEDPAADAAQWPGRLRLALWVMLAQCLAFATVFVTFLMLSIHAVPEFEENRWAGAGYFLFGLVAAPITGAVAGAVTAARVRLPLFGLYALPVLLGMTAFLMPMLPIVRNILTPALLVYLGANVLIALATSGLPRRPRKPRGSDRGIAH